MSLAATGVTGFNTIEQLDGQKDCSCNCIFEFWIQLFLRVRI